MEPCFETSQISLYQGDCLEVMRSLPDSSVDLILTDPPFFQVKKDEWWDCQWEKPAAFLSWLDKVAEQWQRLLKPNGSLYCFASPRMAARVEVMLGDRFNVLNRIRWIKEAGWHNKADKEELRGYLSPWEEIIFCEHHNSDGMAKGESGYEQKCDELRGFVFEPLAKYFNDEKQRGGFTYNQINTALGTATGGGGMASHYFVSAHKLIVTWQLPTKENYAKLQLAFPGYFERSYESLRQEYEELRQEYEELRRPFSVTADVPYTMFGHFRPLAHIQANIPARSR
jgi:site-specific DNA-methyltransferase (adenine-specific)